MKCQPGSPVASKGISTSPLAATVARRPSEPPARQILGFHAFAMFGDPRLGVGFGAERFDRGRIVLRDADLDAERPVLKRDHPVCCLGVRVGLWHGWHPVLPSPYARSVQLTAASSRG